MFNAEDFIYSTYGANDKVDRDLAAIAKEYKAMPDFEEVSFANVYTDWRKNDGNGIALKCADGSIRKLTNSKDFFGAFTLLTCELWQELIEAIDERNYYREVEDYLFGLALEDSNRIYDLSVVSGYRGAARERALNTRNRIMERVSYGAFWAACVIYDACTGTDRNKVL